MEEKFNTDEVEGQTEELKKAFEDCLQMIDGLKRHLKNEQEIIRSLINNDQEKQALADKMRLAFWEKENKNNQQ